MAKIKTFDEKQKEDEAKKKRGKPFFEEIIKCEHCGKFNKVSAVRETIQQAVPAQKTIEVFVEKESQTTLDKK